MNAYQITILEKDQIHTLAINRLAHKFDAIYSNMKTKDGIVYDLEFPSYELMENFRNAIEKLIPKLF